MNKLKNKLSIILILFSLGIIFLISTASNIFIKDNFNKYIKNTLDNKKDEIYRSINSVYSSNDLDINSIESIGMNALENGLIIKIIDNNGTIIWDARTHNNGMCETIIENVTSNMNQINPGVKGTYTVENFDVKKGDSLLATLEIGYYGPFYYSDSDVLLLKTLNEIFIIVALVALVISIVIAVIISHSISKPISGVIKSTNLIAEGHYKERITKSNISEINMMINSVNRLAETLDEQEKIRKVLTKDIAHELRTPLTTIQGQLEALIDGIWEPSEERLNSILDEINRLTRLVGTLGSLSKYESTSLLLEKSEFKINDLLKGILTNFQKQFLDKELTLELELNECTAYVDKDKLSQAVINIISNSIKYSNVGGIINVRCKQINDSISIWIKDNGIGISEEHIPYIFERFYRADESRARATGGSGIGLTISKAIIFAHGGDIKVNSKLNKGSEFIIEIPIQA